MGSKSRCVVSWGRSPGAKMRKASQIDDLQGFSRFGCESGICALIVNQPTKNYYKEESMFGRAEINLESNKFDRKTYEQ